MSGVRQAARAFSTEIRDPDMLMSAIRSAQLEPLQISHTGELSQLSRLETPRLCLDLVRTGPSMLYTGVMPKDCYTLSFVLACPGEAMSFNFGTKYDAGYMGLFSPGAELESRSPAFSADAILTVPVATFEAAVERHFPCLPDPMMAKGGGVLVGVKEQACLRSLIRRAERLMHSEVQNLPEGISMMILEEELLSAFLGGLRSGLSALVPLPNQRTRGRYRRLELGREYIAGNYALPIYLEDLCSAMGLSERGVENTFHDLLGIRPIEYLRHYRLHAAHRQLSDAGPENDSVKKVAMDCGFRHMSRFARDYQNLFGVYPGEILKKVRG